MPDAVIDAEGGVSVEGQHLGRIDGFRFTPDPSADANEAKALKAAAEKALAGEIERRAKSLSESPAEQLDILPDMTVAWHGAPVARLIAGDTPLKPRVSLIADEQLTGPARDKVQDRLDRYVAVTLTNALKPLFDLQDDAEMPGPVRGIAFRLVEALGILDRGPIADEIKGLDQDARSVLRKHGVRFGAFHVFLPLLLKPAPRKLAAQLWALNAGGAAGVSPQEIDNRLVPELVASGRTSVMRDPAIPDTVYGLLGFKPVGKRVVRIDILERLGDAIREAMSWRPLSAAPKPEGHVDGSCFRVAPNMTSLLGCSNEDMAEVLATLGFRKDRRPPPPELEAPQTPEAGAAASDTSNTPADASAATAENAPATADAVAETQQAAPAADAGATTEDTAAEEPGDGLIEVWRPGGRRNQGRGRPQRGGRDAGQDAGGERQQHHARGDKRGKGGKRGGKPGGQGQPQRDRKPAGKPIDPDSPFAKLAALKKDLEGKS